MLHPSDISHRQPLVLKTIANPMDSVQHPMPLQDVQGHQAKVYRAHLLGLGDVVVKMFNHNPCPLQGLDEIAELEVALMHAGLPVAHLLSLHQWNDNGLTQHAAVYPYYAGGDLFTHILRLHRSKDISPQRLESIAHSTVEMLCTCLRHMHQHGWVHVDIKAENIFLSQTIESPDCLAFLGDFGNAVRVGTMISPLTSGSKGYFPAEDFRGSCFLPAQTSLDLFSVGKVLKIFEYIHRLSPHAQAVMNMLLAPAALRPTAAEMLSTHLPEWLSHIQDRL